MSTRLRVGAAAALLIVLIYGVASLRQPYATKAGGFWGDNATYYMMGQSLAKDGDLAYRGEDLRRVLREFPSGPDGLFLKKGRSVTGIHLTTKPPFLVIDGVEESDSAPRFFFGKSFIYPLFAAPFVALFGTNGFLVFNTLLLAVAFLAAYWFLSARSGVIASLLLASAFIFATVVPVYWAWIAPELFNFSIVTLAYFCWLYKHVAREAPARGGAWLRAPSSDAIAGALIGIATFSKVTNVLLFLPMLGWWLVRRDWRRALVASVCWGVLTAGLFAVNVAITGDWNYQGGGRATFVSVQAHGNGFPFEARGRGFEAAVDRRARTDAMTDVLFDPQVFWSNLRANLRYFFVGRYAGMAPYFFPGFLALTAFLFTRRRESWQWWTFGGLVTAILTMIITQPYTYFGSGGAVGDRYFMGIYGVCLFLLPPVRSVFWGAAAWAGGLVFLAKIVVHPFAISLYPAQIADAGPLRMLPVELTNINDLPITMDSERRKFAYGDARNEFQLRYLDDKAFLREADRSFWVRGESRTEVVIKANPPFRQLQLTLSAGPVPTTATVKFLGHTQAVPLAKDESRDVTFDLVDGFPYKKDSIDPATGRDLGPNYLWVLSIASSTGFFPRDHGEPTSPDIRYLGVRVKPVIIP
jgi:hypothetical protein